MQSQDIKQQVQEVYAKAVLQTAQGNRASCGEATASNDDPITPNLYSDE